MSKPRVGILSMQRIANYGSFLQAYGLKSILEDLGAEVQFVDYEPGPCLDHSAIESGSSALRKFDKFREALSYDAPLRDRLAFIKYKQSYGKRFYPLLGLTSESNLHPDLDMLVIGSDEVFNCVQSNANVGFTPALFGHGINASRKITYAASFGNTTEDKLRRHDVAEKVSSWLKELDAISVRDANSERVVMDLTDCEPTLNLDPVLAYDYMGLCDKIPSEIDEKSPYLIVYGYSGRLSDEECAAVRAYADNCNLKVLNIGGVQGCCDRFVDCNPFEVIAYFKHAEAVVTDTFHGSILATITERPFATFVRSTGYGNSQKLDDLLRRLGLSGRSTDVRGLEKILETSVDWNPVRDVILDGRKKSIEYLRSQLACIQN